MEQIVDIPGGGLQDFHSGHGSTASSSSSHAPAGAVDEPFHVVFHTFLRRKNSAKMGPLSGSELSADFISSTPSAYEKAHFSEDGNCFFEEDQNAVALWLVVPPVQ